MRARIRKPRVDINIRFENDSTRRGVNFVYPCYGRILVLSVYTDIQGVLKSPNVFPAIDWYRILFDEYVDKSIIFII